jgi:ribosome-associated translation inhibitor RaiA
MFMRGSLMSIASQVTFEHLDQSAAVEAQAAEQIEQLTKDYGCITSARVVIARPQHRRHKGDVYQIRIHMTISGAPDIAVTHEPEHTGNHEEIQVTIDRAFKAARRQLRDFTQIRQGHVKHHTGGG